MTHTELAKALAAFHADLPEVGKGSTNPAFHSKYADLADIVKVVLPALAKNGLAWTALPTMTEEGFVLNYQLMHVSGESVGGSWPLPDPSKSNAQQLGSAVTYAKRYTLSAVTGIAPDEDDDGNAASTAKRASRPARREPAADNVATALKGISECTDPGTLDQIENWAKEVGIAGIATVKTALAEKRATLGASTTDSWAVREIPTDNGAERVDGSTP